MSDKNKQITPGAAISRFHTDRNTADPERLANVTRAFQEIFGHIEDAPLASILEVGAYPEEIFAL